MSEASYQERDNKAVSRFIERFALDLAAAGVPRMPARVFAGLFISERGSLTAAELAGLLHVSPASISGAVRYLGQLGMVRREREPGSRRDHYVLHDDVWREVINRRDQVLMRWRDSIAHGIGVVGADTPAGRRMSESTAYFDFLHTEMQTIMKKWDDRKADLREQTA